MPITLTDLTLLIRLVDDEADRLNTIIDNPESSDQASDDAAELSVLAHVAAGNLRDAYEARWQEGGNFRSYDELIAKIEQSKSKC